MYGPFSDRSIHRNAIHTWELRCMDSIPMYGLSVWSSTWVFFRLPRFQLIDRFIPSLSTSHSKGTSPSYFSKCSAVFLTQSQYKTPITRSVHCKFNSYTVAFTRTFSFTVAFTRTRQSIYSIQNVIIPFVDLMYTFALFCVREANMYLTSKRVRTPFWDGMAVDPLQRAT